MPDPFEEPKKENKFLTSSKKVLKVTKVALLTRFHINILSIIIIIILSIAGFNYIWPNEAATPTGSVVLEQECQECICEEKECETDCDSCPIKTKVETKNVVYYKCPDESLVTDLVDCESNFPEIPSENAGTVEGVTLIIDNIEYEEDEEDSGFVTRVDYTIINKGDFPLVPKIEVKVYEEWTLKAKKAVANKVVNPEIVVNPNDYVKRQDRVRIFFKGKEQTVRLLLVDSLSTIEREVVAVTGDISLDDLS